MDLLPIYHASMLHFLFGQIPTAAAEAAGSAEALRDLRLNFVYNLILGDKATGHSYSEIEYAC